MAITDDNRILVGLTMIGYSWGIARFDSRGNLELVSGVSFLSLMESNTFVPGFVSGIGIQKSGYYVLVGGAKYPSAGHYDFMVMRFKDNPEGISGIGKIPKPSAVLCQNFPNPFTYGTTISWTQEARSHVSLVIFDILGNQVAMPVNEFRPAGSHRIDFGTGDTGKGNLPFGTYFYRISVRPTEPGASRLCGR